MERQSPQRLKLGQTGELEAVFLTDGLWWNDGGCMFGVVPRELWQRNHPPDSRNRIRLNLTCPLILRGREAVLVDTGIGNRLDAVERRIFGHGDGWLPEGLSSLKLEPGDITYLLLTHLHFDHCGGIVRRRDSGRLESAFPRARLLIQRGELEEARTGLNERLRAAYRHLDECLEPVARQIELLDGDADVIEGVRAVVTGGHTHHHQVVEAGGTGGLVHLGDIVPTRSHLRGPWNQAYDLDALRTMEAKARYLARAVAERSWVSFAHDDLAFAARVARESGRLKLDETVAVPQSLLNTAPS